MNKSSYEAVVLPNIKAYQVRAAGLKKRVWAAGAERSTHCR